MAYTFDDAVLLTIVVVTLSRSRLQEQHGRWLRLFSGTAVLLPGGRDDRQAELAPVFHVALAQTC